MTALAIQKVSGFCPAGTLGEIYSRLEGGQPFEPAGFAGECRPEALKELAGLLPGNSFRRVPRLAKIALRAALEAVDPSSGPGALIISTAYGSITDTFEFLDSILRDGAELASPTAFSHSVANMAAAFVSKYLRVTGPCLTLTQPNLTAALETASALLVSGQAASVLWGTVSEASGLMEKIEKQSGLRPSLLSDGAVFFRLSLPEPKRREPRVVFNAGPAAPPPEAEFGASLAAALGPGSLAVALRLALTSLFFEKNTERPAAGFIINDRERLVVSSGGAET